MEKVRYEIDPRKRWIFSELARAIIEDFKKPETEAEFQKWRAEREAQRRAQENAESQLNQ